MGLLSQISSLGYPSSNVANVGFLAGVNITTLKEKAAEIISGKPKGFITGFNWGSIGNFFFTAYKLPRNISWIDSDEYAEYTTLSPYIEREFRRQNNRTLSFTFTMKQRDVSDQQKEEELFEEDIMENLNQIYAIKALHLPLDLFFYGGQLYMGQYSIDTLTPTIVEMDSGGFPNLIDISLDLTKYPDSQEQINLDSENYFRYKYI